MKHRLQTLLKHKRQWMFLFAALLSVSQAALGTDYPCIKGTINNWSCQSISNSVTVTLSAGDYEFGVCVLNDDDFYKNATITRDDNSKVLSNSGNNAILKADIAGDYIFTWNSGSKTITVTYPPMPTLYLRGIGTWDPTDDNQMSESNGVYTITKSLTAGSDYSFKVADANYSPFNYGKASNNYGNCGDEYVMGTNGDLSYRATITGDHVFTFTLSSKTLEITCPSSCDTPSSSDITITQPQTTTIDITGTTAPATASQAFSADTDNKGNQYQWSVSPATITSYNAGGTLNYDRSSITNGSTTASTIAFSHEGVYTVSFATGCDNYNTTKDATNQITVRPGVLYLSGPLLNQTKGTDYSTNYTMVRDQNDLTKFTYTWTVKSSSNESSYKYFQIKKTTLAGADDATRKHLIPTYASLTLDKVKKLDNDNRNLYADTDNLTYSAGDQLKCTVTYVGPDNNGVPQYTVKLEKVCSAPTLSNFTITGSLEQTLSGLTAISASSNTQGYNPSIEVQYNGSSSLPVATGTYPVTLVVGANGDYCASTVAVGTLNVYEVIVKAKKANIDDWGNDVYLHYWGTCNPGSTWKTCPKMNYDGSEWYTLGLNCTPDNILFKNATGNNPNRQSVDQSFSPDDCYEVLNETNENSRYKVKVYENCQLCTAPTVVTNNTPENVTGTTATLKCTVTEAGDCQNPEIGIAYGTSEHPTSGTEGTVSGGVCSVNLTNLVAGKYYYYRAYTTVGGTTTYGEEYGFYTKPANIYIKGLIIHSGTGCPNPWPTDNTAFSRNADGTVFTKTITARKPNCSYDNVNSDAEFVLMSSTYEEDKLNVKGTFNPDGQNSNWIKSKRSGDHDEKYNFKYSAEYNAGDQLTITVTFMSDGTFKMKVSPACDTEVQKKNISIASSAICSGSSVNVTVASSQSGVTYTVYDAANNEVGTGTGTGGDLNISVSPSASTTFTVKGSQGAACESTTMNNTVDVTVWNAPKYSPTSNITAYLPITITGTAGSSWSITSPSPAGNAWLSNTSGLTTVFKAPAGTYTVQDSNTSCATNSVTITVEADSETCQ